MVIVMQIGLFHFCWRKSCNLEKEKIANCCRSSAEAEYRGMTFRVCELLWLKKLLEELNIDSHDSMKLYYDNTSAIEIVAIQFNMIVQST